MLANKGKKVLLVDCDPQCNLTGMVLGLKGEDEYAKIYEKEGVRNIRDGLAPAFESRPSAIEPVVCESIVGQPNMFLLPGHIGLAEYEVTLGIAQELSGSLITLQNLPGSLHHLFSITAEKYNIDITIIDMSPSLGPINQNLLMTSDYFIVPMMPDYFSVMATKSLATVIPKWCTWAKQAQSITDLKNATYPFPVKLPKFLGIIIQKYKLRESKIPARAFQKWIDAVNDGVKNDLIPSLKKSDLLLEEKVYASAKLKIGDVLIQMSDFNSLIALSQKHKVPVFSLSNKQIGLSGMVLERTKKSMKMFKDLYSTGADKILKMLKNA